MSSDSALSPNTCNQQSHPAGRGRLGLVMAVTALLAATMAIAGGPEAIWGKAPSSGAGESALEHIQRLEELSSGPAPWPATVEYLQTVLPQAGFGDVWRQDLAATASAAYPTAVEGSWRPLRAEVRLKKAARPLLTLEQAPGFVARGSNSVTADAPLVYIKGGAAAADYEGKAVVGRMVLASGALAEVYRLAVVERGALGVLSYFRNELDRGILEPAQIPQRNLGGPSGVAPKPGTFALTLPQGMAEDLQRSLLQKRPVHLRVEIEAESLPASVEAVWTELAPPAEPAGTVLIFAAEGVGEDPSRPGGFAVLLETARIYRQSERDGTLLPRRRTVFLWASHPAAVRAWIAARGGEVAAAWDLGDLGRTPGTAGGLIFIEPPVSRASWWVDWQAWTLERIRRAHPSPSIEADASFVFALAPYRRARDANLLNGPLQAFPTLRLESPAGNHGYDAGELLRAVTAVAVGAAPAIAADEPGDVLLHRACERWRARYAERAAAAGEMIDAARDSGNPAAASRAAWSTLRAAEAEVRARLAAWPMPAHRPEALEACSTGLGQAVQEATDRLALYLQAVYHSRGAEPVAVTAGDAERAASGVVYTRNDGAAAAEVVGSELVAGAERLALDLDPEVVFQALDRSDGNASLLQVFQQLQGELGFGDLEDLAALARTLEARNLLHRTARKAETITLAVQVPPAPEPKPEPKPGPKPEPSPPPRPRPAPPPKPEPDPPSPGPTGPSPELVTESKATYARGLALEAEGRKREALAEYKRVRPASPEEYADAQKRIEKIEREPPPPSEGGYLGVLRATLAQGDGRTIRGSLAQGESRSYSLDIEAPGYGDLEVAVPIGFRVEGSGLQMPLTAKDATKQFAGGGPILARYVRVNIPTGTRIQFVLRNRRSEEPEYECEIYLYPR